MKKFKLIKEYPGSPKLNTIVDLERSVNGQIVQGKWCYDIDKTPEFWEEVVEKDYEIVSLIEGKLIYPCDKYSKDYINQLFNTLGVSIHSVKRLSDGEVFTVGDSIETGIIKTIFLPNDTSLKEITFHVTNDDEDTYLSEAIKSKQPLFKTEDGVDIYEGDTYYELITPDFHNKPCIWNILPNKTRDNINYDQEGNRRNGRIWFSTNETAEEYIMLNKKQFSYLDVEKYLTGKGKTNLLQELTSSSKN